MEKTMLLGLRDAAFGYEGQIVVRDLNISVNAGDWLCVVGENGSGKTTLVKGLLRLAAPLQGEVIRGEGIKQNEIGWLSQQAAAKTDFPASVREIVLSGFAGRMGLRPFYSRREKKAANENLARTGTSALARKCFRELSGGQQRRVLVARALSATEKLLVLDEPAAGLDPAATAELYALLEKLNREQGIAIIMVSHDTDAASRYAKTVLHVQGRQLFFGNTAEYLDSEEGKSFFRNRVQKEDHREH